MFGIPETVIYRCVPVIFVRRWEGGTGHFSRTKTTRSTRYDGTPLDSDGSPGL